MVMPGAWDGPTLETLLIAYAIGAVLLVALGVCIAIDDHQRRGKQ